MFTSVIFFLQIAFYIQSFRILNQFFQLTVPFAAFVIANECDHFHACSLRI